MLRNRSGLSARCDTPPKRPGSCRYFPVLELLEVRETPTINFDFALGVGSTTADGGQSVTTDPAGNIYLTGYFQNTVDFDPGPGATPLTSAGGQDVFVAKYTSTGSLAWAVAFGGALAGDAGNGIAVDASGNVHVTGYFSGTVDFDPGAGTTNLTSAAEDAFVLKLDTGGNFLWATQRGGAGNDRGYGIAVDGIGNVHVTGDFNEPAARSMFIVKLDSGGNLLWNFLSGDTPTIGHNLAVDATGNVYTTGYFAGTVDFDPGAGTFNLVGAGTNDIFVSKLDSGGNFVWALGMGGTGIDRGYGIALDSAGDVYVSGDFSATVDFDPGAATFNLTSAALTDIFVAKYTAAGAFSWANRIGGVNSDVGYSLFVTGSGTVYTTGSFLASADFDPGPGTFTLTTAGSVEVFVSKLDSAGNFLDAVRMGGSFAEQGRDITVTSDGHIYTVGEFPTAATDFDPTAGTFNLTSAGGTDIFLSALFESYITITPSGTTDVTEGGATDTYTVVLDLLPTADVIVTITPDSQVTVSPTTLTFTPGDWNTPQTITITAVDDALRESLHRGVISHTASSADVIFNNGFIAQQTVDITDNELPNPVLYGLQYVGGQNRLLTIDTVTGAGTLVGTINSAPLNFFGLAFQGNRLYGWDQSANRIREVDPVTAAILNTIDIGLTAGTEGDIAFRSDGIGFLASGSPNQLTTFDLAGPSSTPVGSVGVMDGLAFDNADVLYGLGQGAVSVFTINQATGAATLLGGTGLVGMAGSGGIAFDPLGNLFAVASTGGPLASSLYRLNPSTGVATLIGAIGFNNLCGLVFGPLPSLAGVTVAPGAIAVAEGGPSVTYTIVLNAAPTADVSVTLTPDSQTTMAPGALTFTPLNWNVAQTVTVFAVDDALTEGPHSGVIGHTAASADLSYNGIAISSLTASITDNDAIPAGVTIAQSAGSTNVAEGGTGDSYTLVLNTAPTANVLLTLVPNSQLAVTPTTLTFTPANWNIAQTATVSAIDDAISEGVHSGILTHSASSADAAYNALAIPALTANVTDNDVAGVLFTHTAGNTTVTEAGPSDTVTAVLNSQPTANVILTLSSDVQTTVVPNLLTFTPLNWNVAQTATVLAVNDAIAEGVHSGFLAATTSSADTNYNALVIASLTASITDNDTPSVTITPTGGTTNVAEGGASDTYLVILATQPTANVLITLSPAASLTTSPSVLTFTAANWNTAQTVTVTAIDDAIFQGPHTGVVTHTSTSADASYNALAIAGITAGIADNEPPPGISLTQPAATQEGATTSYTIVLQTAPAANVVVNLAPDTQVSVVPTSVVFTMANWNVPQTVAVSTIDDTVPEFNQTGIITHTISSGDPAYNALAVPPATVSIIDNDGTLVLGTDRDDRILVNFVGGKVQAVVNGKSSYLLGSITQILVLAGEGNDFVQITTPTVPVVVLGGSGNDAVWVIGTTGYNTFVLDSAAVTLNNKAVSIGEVESFVLGGRTGNDTFRIQTLPPIPTELKGDRGIDTVVAPDTANDWQVTSTSGGTLNGSLIINAVENWLGGTGDDTFTFTDRKTVAGKIDGGGGNDTLDYAAYTAPVTVNLQTGVATGTKTIANIASFRGGLASDRLIGADQSNAWSLADNNVGDVNGILFESFENLTGGKLDDTFTLADGIGVSGKIDGGAGVDGLDYSRYSTAIAVNLQARTATATAGMLNFEQFVGGADIDTLTGANVVNKWTFTATGSGLLNKFNFSEFENFTGGSNTDTFTVAASLADWLGVVNGGSGRDSLFAFATGVNLWTNGATGAGTLNGRAFAGIELRR